MAAAAAPSKNEEVTIGLITKTETNPFFVKMKEGAQAQAKKDNVKLLTASGKTDTDNASQVTALENMTTQGAKVILDVPADSKAVVPAIKKARDAGVIVIALDTPTEPQDAVDALFATDNMKAGVLIGQYAKAAAEKQGITPKIAMIDLAPGISVGQLRHDGFLEGFGIKEGDPQIVGAAPAEGDQTKGQAAMENLLQKEPGINVIYTINEPSAFGGRDRAEGGRQGPEGLRHGLRRRRLQGDQGRHQAGHHRRDLAAVPAEDGGAGRGEGRGGGARRREAVRLRRHRRRRSSPADPMDGVDSKDAAYGEENCWG